MPDLSHTFSGKEKASNEYEIMTDYKECKINMARVPAGKCHTKGLG